jgi:hypothetical protein
MKTGSVKQVAAFGKLVGICNDLGASYNPSKANLKPTALSTLLEQAQQSVEAVNVARTAFILAVNARKESYSGIHKLAARIARAVSASEGSEENIRDAKIIKRKLVSRSKPAKAGIPSAAEEGQVPGLITRSSSRLDYDGKADTFANLIQIVQGMEAYNPNEADLKVETLKAVLTDLKTRSQAYATSQNALASARIARNTVLYGKGGVYETGTAVKEYIRSVYGMRSEPSRELSKVRL